MPFDNPHEKPFGDIELLLAARSRISSGDHWIKRQFQNGDRYCLVAVLSVTAGSQSYNHANRVERRLTRLLAKQLAWSFAFLTVKSLFTARWHLMCFNDNPRTTHEDVMALFDRTIDHLAVKAPVYVSD
jgi:hypothetical protein